LREPIKRGSIHSAQVGIERKALSEEVEKRERSSYGRRQKERKRERVADGQELLGEEANSST